MKKKCPGFCTIIPPPRTEAAQIFPHFSSCNWLITIFYNIFIYNIITYNQ